MKKYFISKRVVEQAERMKDKILYFISELDYKLETNNITLEKYRTKRNALQSEYEKVNNALNSLTCEGYSLKGTWNNIQILKEYAIQRDIMDSML